MILKKRKYSSSPAHDPGAAYHASPKGLPPGVISAIIPLKSDLEKGALARKGLPKQKALLLQSFLGLNGQQMSALLDMSYRTFQRKGPEDLLGLSSTEQLIEIAEVVEHAMQVFHSPDTILEWLNSPLPGLNGQKPIELLDTSFGIRAVRQALGRLEHGVLS